MIDSHSAVEGSAQVVVSTSLRGLAREIGVDDKTIRKGIKSGRLRDSIGHTGDGVPFVIDLELAKQEWTSNGGQVRAGVRIATSAPAAGRVGTTRDDSSGPAVVTLVDAQRAATIQRERKLRIDNDVAEGRLVPVDVVAKEAFTSGRTIRESMLNIPARLSGELAAETDAGKIFVMLDAAIRDALNSAATALEVAANA